MLQKPVRNVATATGATSSADIDVRRIGTIVVAYKLAGTVTAGDLTVIDPVPYDSDGVLMTVGLPAKTTLAPAASGADVVALRTYDCVGIERLRLAGKNNNAGTLNLSIDVFGANEGRM